jgi:hypothetical protein
MDCDLGGHGFHAFSPYTQGQIEAPIAGCDMIGSRKSKACSRPEDLQDLKYSTRFHPVLSAMVSDQCRRSLPRSIDIESIVRIELWGEYQFY